MFPSTEAQYVVGTKKAMKKHDPFAESSQYQMKVSATLFMP